MDHNPWGRALIILGVIAVGGYLAGEVLRLASHFGDITLLFFLAWLLAFVLLPIVRYIDRRVTSVGPVPRPLVYLALLFGSGRGARGRHPTCSSSKCPN